MIGLRRQGAEYNKVRILSPTWHCIVRKGSESNRPLDNAEFARKDCKRALKNGIPYGFRDHDA